MLFQNLRMLNNDLSCWHFCRLGGHDFSLDQLFLNGSGMWGLADRARVSHGIFYYTV